MRTVKGGQDRHCAVRESSFTGWGERRLLQALKDAGYEENVNLQVDFHNAQGDMNNNLTIAQKLVGDKTT